jgi:DNA polymerase-3 subunit epsilon
MELVAIDLEGSGAQDRDHEAILEIALVPIVDWQPDITAAYCTLVNPLRPIPRRPWISPGLTDPTLRTAPTIAAVEPELARRINGRYLVGHNVSVDWRLLHRRCPAIIPAGLIDTLALARKVGPTGPHGLAALIERHRLSDEVDRLAPGSIPHRALWDAVACCLLLATLIPQLFGDEPDADALLRSAGVRADGALSATPSQPSLFDQAT